MTKPAASSVAVARDVPYHVAQAKIAVGRCRRLHGDVKMLIVCDGLIQKAEMMKVAARERAGFNDGPHDRRAFVVPSSLLKLQVSRLFDGSSEQCFLSENAAITWLLAEREGRVRRSDRAA